MSSQNSVYRFFFFTDSCWHLLSDGCFMSAATSPLLWPEPIWKASVPWLRVVYHNTHMAWILKLSMQCLHHHLYLLFRLPPLPTPIPPAITTLLSITMSSPYFYLYFLKFCSISPSPKAPLPSELSALCSAVHRTLNLYCVLHTKGEIVPLLTALCSSQASVAYATVSQRFHPRKWVLRFFF